MTYKKPKHATRSYLLASILFSFASGTAFAAGTSCPSGKAVYSPSPGYSRTDGIHYTLTLENEQCTPPLCPKAMVRLNTYSAADELLSRTTMHYFCAGGDSRYCYAALRENEDSPQSEQIRFKVVALNGDFTQAGFLGGNDKAAYALIFPGMPASFRTPNVNWEKYPKSFKLLTSKKFSNEMAPDEFTPETWIVDHCQ